MPYSRISGSLSSPNFDVVIDMGNPFLNRTVDGFLKIGTVSASRVAAEETYNCLRKGSVSSHMMKETVSLIISVNEMSWGNPGTIGFIFRSPNSIVYYFWVHLTNRSLVHS
ncbi:hypothetical protein QJS10_CPA03g01591 [Acorus calamus]|uniref:Uncharacterized protein n=1 Tax=Acorus calamus TaxID=4465 RepID=A0AAV9F9Z6_ACOCL|nr:hypothetical protein QJS10_CPA03g01591 [Acorus calamus]